jgi:MFS family permease
MRLHTLKELDSSEGTVTLHADGDDGIFVLHPTPNPNDPNDPLRWPRWKKHVCFGSVCAFTFLGNFAIGKLNMRIPTHWPKRANKETGGLAPAFYILSIEFNKTQSQTSQLLLWPILVLGAFNFFWVPMANYLGKRPIFVFASLLLSLSYLWGAVANSFESLLWSNIIAAFAASSTEALGASIVNDLYFLHERANLMGVYMNFISGGNTIGPLICGFIASTVGWRWHKWLAFILTAINFLAVVFLCPETRYDRSHLETLPPSMTASSSSIGKVSDEEEAAPVQKTTSSNEKDLQERRGTQVQPKTYVQQLSLWTGVPKDTSLLRLFLRPFPFIAYPAVAFSFLGYA